MPTEKEIYCHECSKAGGAETAIYHLPPICEKRKTEWDNPDEIELRENQDYWILFPDNQTSKSRYIKGGWKPYGNRMLSNTFMVAEIKPPAAP